MGHETLAEPAARVTVPVEFLLQWDDEIVPQLIDYIRIPAKSPHFDSAWEANGHIERAIRLFRDSEALRDPDIVLLQEMDRLIAAGMKGIENKYVMPDPVEVDIYHLSAAERANLGIQELPGSLYEALCVVQKSKLVRDTLGEHIYDKFVENKKVEWDRFRVHVSQFEIDRYLPML